MKQPFLVSIVLLLLVTGAVSAQELAPPEVTGEAVYIPFPVAITLDGNLEDWADVPHITVDRGPTLSTDPAENGSFTFAVAADAENFYITMASVDTNIITGQHGTDFWNEDSLEFYLNLSGERYATSYGDGIFQININPGDIGNTDPSDITITGVGSSSAQVQAFVFETDDGWGFEAAVPLADWMMPEHGLEIGFQAQANGASETNRDVKLIWSLADTNDQSWSDPSLFGSGVFFEIGQTDVPEYSERSEPVEAASQRFISLNQVGYFPDSPKYGMLAAAGESRTVWSLLNADTEEEVAGGMTTAGQYDSASGDTVQVADFSEVTTPGTYLLVIDSVRSAPFQIGTDLYNSLKTDAIRYFYLNRSGIELDAEHAGGWAREAGHVSDNDITCYSGTDAAGQTWDGCNYRLDGSGGWYDAGDYGKYVVNGGIATWTLQNLYERLPESFDDGSLNIPEGTNGIPDVLDEARWEMEFLLRMQVPEGQELAGMAHHKLHDRRWSGVPVMPPMTVENDDPENGRFVYPASTAATLNLAATAAQCARIWRAWDDAFATRCLTAAERAWQAANEHPDLYAGNTPGEGGGNYDDRNVDDEFYWAAAELYVTTGEQEYLNFVKNSRYFDHFPGLDINNVSSMAWPNTAALGTITLAMVADPTNRLDPESLDMIRGQIVEAADRVLATMEGEGYRVSIREPNYYWGSNSDVANNGIILALAYDFTLDPRYLYGVTESMDYLLGRNANGISFVSGYGENAMQHPHHRFWGNQPASGFPPPPPGALSGGPNGNPVDEAALDAGVLQLQPAKRYVDMIGSYSTNEVAINWNAPLAWVASYLDDHYSRE